MHRRWPAILLVLVLALGGAAMCGCAASRTLLPAPAAQRTSYAPQRQPAPGSCHARGHGLFSLPDPRCTPGRSDPAVTQANIHLTICQHGYTRRVRPPYSITRVEKRESMAAYGDPGSPHGYEYDHLIPLELGGAPNDPRNLWPEPGRTPNPKDRLERRLHRLVCAGEVTLRAAQMTLAERWVAAYHQFYGGAPPGSAPVR